MLTGCESTVRGQHSLVSFLVGFFKFERLGNYFSTRQIGEMKLWSLEAIILCIPIRERFVAVFLTILYSRHSHSNYTFPYAVNFCIDLSMLILESEYYLLLITVWRRLADTRQTLISRKISLRLVALQKHATCCKRGSKQIPIPLRQSFKV